MRTIYLDTKDPFILGKTGESNRTALRVKVESWYQEYPDGHGVILFMRPNKVVYPLETNLIVYDGAHYLEAIVTDNETKLAGYTVVTAQWYDGETLAHGIVFSGKILTSAGNGPIDGVKETTPTWVSRLIAELATINETAATVQEAYEKMEEAVSKIDEALTTAEETVAQAQDAAEAAQTAKTNAATSAAAAAVSATQAMSTTPEGYNAMVASLARVFDPATAYSAEEYVNQNSTIYRFTEDHAAGDWTGTDAVAVKMADDLGDLKSAFDYLAEKKTLPVLEFREVSGTQRVNKSVSIPAGTYRVTVQDLVTDDTDGEHGNIYFYYEGSGSVYINAPHGGTTDETVTFENTVARIMFLASYNVASSQGDTFTYTGFALSKALTDETLSTPGIPADAGAVKTALDEIGIKLDSAASTIGLLPLTCGNFQSGKQLQNYQVGRVARIVDDASGTRALTMTPLYVTRRTFLTAPANYEFWWAKVAGETDWTVQSLLAAYTQYVWLEKDDHVFLTFRRTDRAALTDTDMELLNNWIDFKNKVFSVEDVKRVCAVKKTFYDGTGTTHGNSQSLFTMAHLTDIHTDVQRYMNFRQFVDENRRLIDCAICTGDYVDGQNDEQWAAMNAVTGEVDVLQVVGNHDAGHQAGDTLIGDAELVTKFGITTDTGKMYYCKDYDGDMRLIVLNQFEGATKGTYVYSAEEIEWLLGVLDESASNGKHVIIAVHIPDKFPVSNTKGFYERYNRYASTTAMESGIEAVIDAFRKGESVSVTLTGGIAVNHSFVDPGDFLCWLCGHYHGDFIGYSPDHPDQLYLMGNSGVAYPFPFKTTYMGATNSDLARIPGTPSEDCFNVYAFDLYERTVKVARVGSNLNDRLEDRKTAVFSLDGE